MLTQSTRQAARGPVARLVAEGGRNTHEWTAKKNDLLKVYDECGITGAFMEPSEGGYIEGPKNFVLALVAFELCWVDGGASTASLANNLGLEPIAERGTPEQRQHYMSMASPNNPGGAKRFAFALTEPLPYVGIETGMLSGKMRIAEWKEGQEPMIQVEKRARFITNSDYASVAVAAVDTDDPRIKTSCMIILEEGDPGSFDRGSVTRKQVHQLSSTRDPVFNLKVPASRIVGGYRIEDGKIVPTYSHSEVIEAVFRRTRVTVGVMTCGKLLSAVEPVIRYHRNRFRGAAGINAGTPRYDSGIQSKEDSLHRLADVWATGEAGTSLGFATARLFDTLAPVEKAKDVALAAQGIKGSRSQMKALNKVRPEAIEYLKMKRMPEGKRDAKKFAELEKNPLIQYVVLDSLANVMVPATKLWCTGVGTDMMRQSVAMMGGYGITEDCPGFLFNKWVDGQLEATYEGPEAVQRRQLSVTMIEEVFSEHFRGMVEEMRALHKANPETGAGALAETMELWQWGVNYLQTAVDSNGQKLYTSSRQGVSYPMADAVSWIMAAYNMMVDVEELRQKGPATGAAADGLPGLLNFYYDLTSVQVMRTAGEVSRIVTELVYGYVAPGSVPAGEKDLLAFRGRVERSLGGLRMAKDRAGEGLSKVMIPEALDYPAA
jgi:alkylation response protein AidB-like acyl-CoA dehydrogenase